MNKHFDNVILCLSNHSQPPRDGWKGARFYDQLCPCVRWIRQRIFWWRVVNFELINNKKSTFIKLGTSTGNVICQFQLKYYIIKALIIDFKLAKFWMLYSFFWVNPQRLKLICWSFGTPCLYRRCHLLYRVFRNVGKKFRRRGITQKKEYNKVTYCWMQSILIKFFLRHYIKPSLLKPAQTFLDTFYV